MSLKRTLPRPDDITEEMVAQVKALCEQAKAKPGSLIPVLQKSQGICGYLPSYVQAVIAEGLGVPRADVYGVTTFYSYFTMVPRGRNVVKVCLGTACFVRGASETVNTIQRELKIRVGQTTEDRRYTLEAVRCLGACGLAPVTVINEDTHRQLTSDRVMEVVNRYQ